MAQERTFDGIEYFKAMAKENRLCRENGFCIDTCTGPENLQGVMDNWREKANFVLVDDNNDGRLTGNGVGRFVRRVYTVFIIMRYEPFDMAMRHDRLEVCRRIFRQFVSYILRDRWQKAETEAFDFMNLDNLYYRELGKYSMNGVTGLYFMLENDEPINLEYNEREWQTEEP